MKKLLQSLHQFLFSFKFSFSVAWRYQQKFKLVLAKHLLIINKWHSAYQYWVPLCWVLVFIVEAYLPWLPWATRHNLDCFLCQVTLVSLGKCHVARVGIFTKIWAVNFANRTARIRHQCKKTAVLSCHRCLINTSVEKGNNI